MALEDFIKLHWLVMQAEARCGENALLCFDGGDGGDGGGSEGGTGGGEPSSEPDDPEEEGGDIEDDDDDPEGAEADYFDYEDAGTDPETGLDFGWEMESTLADLSTDPNADPEADYGFDPLSEEDAAVAGFGPDSSVGVSADPGTALEVSGTPADVSTAMDAAYGYGPDVTDITAMDQAVAPDVNMGLEPEGMFTDFGVAREDVATPSVYDQLAEAMAAQSQAPDQPFDQQNFDPNAPAIFEPNANFAIEPTSVSQVAAAPNTLNTFDPLGYTTTTAPAATPPMDPNAPGPYQEQTGPKDITDRFENTPGLVGTQIGPVGPEQAGARGAPAGLLEDPSSPPGTVGAIGTTGAAVAGAAPFDDPRGDFVGTQQDPATGYTGYGTAPMDAFGTFSSYPSAVQETKGDFAGFNSRGGVDERGFENAFQGSFPSDRFSAAYGTQPPPDVATPVQTTTPQESVVTQSSIGTPQVPEMQGMTPAGVPFSEIYGARAGISPNATVAGRFGDWAPPVEPPVGPQIGSQFPSGLVFGQPDARSYADLLGPTFGQPTQVASREPDPWEQNQQASRDAAPRPDAPQRPDDPRPDNPLEQATGLLAGYLGGQQTAGGPFDPGANATGSDDFLNPRYSTAMFENFASADPLAAAAPPVGSSLALNQPTPTNSVNQAPYVPAQPPRGTGQYAQPGFDVAPERGYPAERIPRNLRDAIAAALLKQTQDRLRT